MNLGFPPPAAKLRLIWKKIWRLTPLTSKALIATVLLGIFFWISLDWWQSERIRELFHEQLLKGMHRQAEKDRHYFDDYIRQQEQAVRLVSHLTPFVHYVEENSEAWQQPVAQITEWNPNNRPPWLPPRSVLRGWVAAPYILLLDAAGRVREQHVRDAELAPLSAEYLRTILPRLLTSEEHTHIAADAKGDIFLLTLSGVGGDNPLAHPKALLVFFAPLNHDFLALFRSKSDTQGAVAFIHGENNRVIASSQPDTIRTGMHLEQLQEQYLVFGKRFLDYSFAVDVPIHFATLEPLSALEEASEQIVQAERHQRTIGYLVIAGIFLILVFAIARQIQNFTERMLGTAIQRLGLKRKKVASGDQLLVMAEQFYWMTNKIAKSRQREEFRQHELQQSNEALRNSLVMIKRAQSQLMEAEKMASLGSLVAGVAHEINTPVGTGYTAASFLEQRGRECRLLFEQGNLRKSDLEMFFRDLSESTTMIAQNLARAAELIRSFKLVAVDRTNEERRLFRLNEYIHHVLLSLRPRLKQTRHSVSVDCPESLTINSYPGVFSQIITNLLVNSLQHAFQPEEEGKIIVQVVVTEGDILFCYSDNGRGMQEKDRARLFEPFFTTARHRGGTGLGMHIVYNLVTQVLKGRIECISGPDQGTRYAIHIPSESASEG
ncbi:MAG: HAMP domain-containing histidine kinase [Magnetococcales bacterium]|nr:HAMP domain-containing histidine kinase [Magnetococcales bacterium]MBF0115568.1 HAMP domain-containing histidine kinase [Magnetococcales bacterium]